MKKKPTYTLPVAVCATVLFVGAALLYVLMATRTMAPPRKYAVDVSGSIIGVDTTTKIPVLTKEEAEKVEVKENKKIDYVEPEPQPDQTEEAAPEPVIVPSVPPKNEEDAPEEELPPMPNPPQ